MKIDPTAIAAWWGAIIASMVLAWDVYKHKSSGPKVRVNVFSGMAIFGFPDWEEKTLITVDIVNVGNSQTTLTSITCVYYKSWIKKLRNKPIQQFAIPNPTINYPLPFVLEPGKKWNGAIHQTSEVEEMAIKGYLMCHVRDSWNKKSSKQRIIIRKTPDIDQD